MLLAAFTLVTYYCAAHENDKFNLGFEQQKETEKLSDGWFQWGGYELSIESDAYTGEKAGKITATNGGEFGSIAYSIPANYSGSVIKLEGYMKIKDVKEGFAGLLLRIDGSGTSLEFDNMQGENISGTRDWKQYSITLNYPEGADRIFVAGILAGKGEAWFDNFVLTIDGKDVQTLKEVAPKKYKAQEDKQFDQGSTIELSELNSQQIQDLEVLGRVWGFLKYHHPAIATGNYNWDYELFRFLPKYLKAKNDKARNKLLATWINNLGKVKTCKSCEETAKDSPLQPNLTWMNQLESGLKDKLLHIYANRTQGKHYYIDKTPYVGNPKFKHEAAYPTMTYPDDGFRLLTLFRYWNMIHYFFPYKHLMDENWEDKLAEYIPLFAEAKDELAYEFAAVQLIGDIQDTHANLWGGADKIAAWKGEFYAPIRVRFVENQLVVVDYYNKEHKEEVGLAIGDVITSINGKSVADIVAEKSAYYPASNEPTRLRDIGEDILRSNNQEVTLEYTNANATQQNKIIKLYPREALNHYRWYRVGEEKCYQLLDNNIGYVTLANIQAEDIDPIKEDFKNTKGIIIDIRNYPSTFVPFLLGSYFISSPTPFVKFTTTNLDNPGEFSFTKELKIPNEGKAYSGKLIILTNELSQSQAEYTAMAFRAGDNTTIIGSTTAGADGNVSNITLPGGLTTMISGIGVYYPDGGETQRVGIVPDIQLTPTVEGIRAGKDELLEKAIQVILEE